MRQNTLNIDNINFTICSDNTIFGDGQHETTAAILELMSQYDFNNKTVLDIGTGTGILAIFAKLKGAKEVRAIDNNLSVFGWAYKNSKENNAKITFDMSYLTEKVEDKFDIILANLSTPEQVENLKTVDKYLKEDGILLISWLNFLPLERHIEKFEIKEVLQKSEYDIYVLQLK